MTHFYILVFQRPTETSIKGIKKECVEFIDLLIILRGTIDMNKNSLDKFKMQVLLTEICIKGICLRYPQFINSLSILKDSVDMN